MAGIAGATIFRHLSPGHSSLFEQLRQITGPVLKHFAASVPQVVRRTCNTAGTRIDHHAAMDGAELDGGYAWDIPGLDGLRAVGIGQVTRCGAHLNLPQARRHAVIQFMQLRLTYQQCIYHAKE